MRRSPRLLSSSIDMTEYIRTLVNYPKEYNERMQILFKSYLSIPEEESRGDTEQLLNKLTRDRDKTLRVLAIGSGTGSKDAMLINILIQKYREIYYKVIEPCKDACAEFKKVIHSNQAAWRGVHFNFYVQTIEEHLNEKGGMNYDLIHCIHSTYHIANLKQSLVELYRMLADSGMLFIRVSSGNWEKCYLKTSEYYHDPKTNYKGASFVKDSIVQSIPRVTMTTQYREMPINVTQCFQEGGSENGDKMTDFIFQILNFRKTVPQERRDSLLRYFREQCSVTKNGMVVLYDGEEDIAFFK